ncbi:MAG: tetratricopeptide repeat protein [Anaerolineae bacterium]|nr:tetratricopeptide repeat protein [Anaerolineae bacterium]
MLEFSLLGVPSLTLDGKPITGIPSKKVLLLLCYLALENKRPHAREKLAFLLWEELPEQRGRANLSQALYDIQQVLPGCLSATNKTISLEAGYPHWVDVLTFQKIAERQDAGIAELEEAISLICGDFLDGLYVDGAPEIENWINRERDRCRQLHLSVLDKLTEHYILQSKWDQATDYAMRTLHIEPWREISYRQMMVSLVRQGKYEAALAQYETCRRVLEEELGVSPTPETVFLYERIQKARTSIRRHNLPTAPHQLVGRQTELDILESHIHDPHCRLISLVGPGGIGKTRLSCELAVRHVHEFLDGVTYVPLVSVSQPEFLVTAVAEAMDIQFSGSTSPREQLIDALARQEVLMVLDGFEHLIPGAELVVDILHGAPEVKIIVTSREKLDLQAEWVFVVEGLSVPPEGIDNSAQLEHYGAVEHFVQSAKHQKSGFVLRGQEIGVSRLCRALGGSPLGIELATALLPVASCTQIAAEVEQNLDILTTTWRDVPERHRSLRAVFDHSWQLLSADEQAAFAALSIFRGSFSLEAAHEVAGADLPIISRLIAKSLLVMVVAEEDKAARYEIHENLRQYAADKLACEPDRQSAVRTSYLAYYARFMKCQEDALGRRDYLAVLHAISSELGNIRAAWQWAVAHLDLAAIDQIMLPLFYLYEARGWFQEGIAAIDQVVERLSEQAPATRTIEAQHVLGRSLAFSGACQIELGNNQEARRLAQKSIDILRPQGASRALAFAVNVLGGVYMIYAEDHEAAKACFRESIAIYRELGRQSESYALLGNLGLAHMNTGDYQSALRVLEEGLALCHKEGYRPNMVKFLNSLGTLHHIMKNWEAAEYYYEQVLPLSEETGTLRTKALAFTNLGTIHVRQGSYEQAVNKCQAGIALMRQTDDRPRLASGLKWLGLAYHGLGNEKAACQSLIEGANIALMIDAPYILLDILIGGAVLLLDHGLQETGIDLLMTAAQHPATTQGDRDHALELLAEQGITLSEDEPFEEKRPLAEIAGALLAALKSLASSRVPMKYHS